MTSRAQTSALVAIVVLAFGIRFVLAITQVRTNWFIPHGISIYAAWAFNIAKFGRVDIVENSMSGQLYLAMAQHRHDRLVDPADIIASGQVIVPEPPGRFLTLQPGHSVVMGVIWALTRDYRFISIVVGQALLDALVCLLAYAVAGRIWGSAGGLAGALGYAVFVPQAQLTAYAAPNVWCAGLLLALCWLFARAPESWAYSRRRLLLHGSAVGGLIGLGTLTLSTYAAMILPAALLALRYLEWRKALVWLSVVAAVFGLVLVPWSMRAWRVSGEFRPVPNVFWYNLHWGLIEQRDSPFGDDAAFGWPRQEELVIRHFRSTRGISGVPSPGAERAFRAAVVEMLGRDPLYVLGVTGGRLASILLMSGRSELVERTLYTLGADMTFYTRQSLECYRFIAEQPSARQPSYCDSDYVVLNPWPEQTRWFVEWLVWISHPFRIEINGIGPYANVGDATLGLLPLAVLAFMIGWCRAPVAATGYVLVVLGWSSVYAINHVEPRYVAAAHALLWVAACAGVVRLAASGPLALAKLAGRGE